MTIEQAMALLTESQQALNQATLIEDRKRLNRHRIDLEAALARCAAAAEAGYAEASKSLKFMQESITRAREQLISIGSQRAGNDQGQALVQLKGAVEVMATARQEALRDINGNHARLGTFNITIFGRTMTGKSTLMEILTRGDGASIGKGAQRATRDIRSYQWNGMKVSDIPGIAAFDGAEDEKLAHQAAEQADLIIYLITDDGPQLAEAEHLATLRNTGVPMLGICNVKRAVGENRQLKLFLRTQERIFERQRLNEIINQFQQITDQYNAGPPVIFRSAHLEARRMADQSEYERIRTELMLASRFPDIEDHILKEVSTNGTFHRTRSFLRSASQASLSVWEQMLVCSNAAYEIMDRLKDHVGETETWRQQFKRDASQRIRSALNGAIGTLRREIPAFLRRRPLRGQATIRKVEPEGTTSSDQPEHPKGAEGTAPDLRGQGTVSGHRLGAGNGNVVGAVPRVEYPHGPHRKPPQDLGLVRTRDIIRTGGSGVGILGRTAPLILKSHNPANRDSCSRGGSGWGDRALAVRHQIQAKERSHRQYRSPTS